MLKNKKKLVSLTAGALLSLNFAAATMAELPRAEAAFEIDSDTDAGVLNFIENRRRSERENRLTEDQKQLLKDAYEMKENLREPLDPTKNVPVAVEGDELFYDQNNGDFIVHGNVVLTSLDKRRFITEHADGNLQTQDVEVEDEAYMLQLTDEQARIIMTGYKTQYNWGTETGQMEDAKGKIDHQYVKAKRIEFYPDKVVLFDASATKCSAEHPDYHMTAKKIEHYPGVETISYNLTYWLGSIPVYSSPKQVTKEGDQGPHLPKATYNNDDGFGLKDTIKVPMADRVYVYDTLYLSQRQKVKNDLGLVYETKGFGTFALRSGFYNDSDDKWIHKSPSLSWEYDAKIGRTPFNYELDYEHGKWEQDGKHSIHTNYDARLSVDPVKLGTWRLFPSIKYSIVDETYNHSRISGFGYDITGVREWDDRWVTYLGFHYSKSNKRNSVFDFDLDDYSSKATAGFSYTFSDKDRIVVGWAFDTERNKLKDTDYYWYHDLHCAQLIVRYREKRDQWKVMAQFTPW